MKSISQTTLVFLLFSFIASSVFSQNTKQAPDEIFIKTIKNPNGQTKAEYQYKKGGIFHGYYHVFYPNGKMKIKGQYKNRKQTGTWVYYNPDGTINKNENYNEDGKKISKQLFSGNATYTENFNINKPFDEIKKTVKKVFILNYIDIETKYFHLPENTSVSKNTLSSNKEMGYENINNAVNIAVSQKINIDIRKNIQSSIYKEFSNSINTSGILKIDKANMADAIIKIKIIDYGFTTEQLSSGNYVYPFITVEMALLGKPPFAVKKTKGRLFIKNQEKHPIIWAKEFSITFDNAKKLPHKQYTQPSLENESKRLYDQFNEDSKMFKKIYGEIARILSLKFVNFFKNES